MKTLIFNGNKRIVCLGKKFAAKGKSDDREP